ncbi:aminodeoxychorismate synthase component 1 [Candidatus Ishikawella capsulata]|uniref:aminodeoxychorismate synthase n=1 Tax=Candidatus Ishikawaella capsulata Mpkobe TaxID=476281 RepID=C5WCM9_9ENTR|nr:aminodeoxychorismate synthase component 1 [Candidatus Ishikawaella capsulata]BAH83085.1 para-aminobenzoate synthase component I [Candidatus Ishikawaella capsulata Mpkobe]
MILKKLILDYSPESWMKYFSAISHLPWAILLSSGQADHDDNRFDIITADPVITLTTCRKKTTIIKNNKIYSSFDDPLVILQQQLCHFNCSLENHPDLPFIGGAMGLFGYDLGRHFEKLPSHSQADLQTPDMTIGIYNWSVIIDHHLQKVTLVSLENPYSRYTWLIQYRNIKIPVFKLTSPWNTNIDFKQYSDKFNKIKEFITFGDCYQVNLGQRFHANYCGDEWQAFCELNVTNKAPFSAFLRLPYSCLLSFSPERFIKLNDKIITTSPIKGTLPRLYDPVSDQLQIQKLSSSLKERAENLMIVDLLRNDLGSIAKPGSVCVTKLFEVKSFPAVHHLVSTVQAYLDNGNATDLLRACFPGGSITGVPKIRAMEIIEELEPHCRNAWCGSIGYISLCGQMDTNINIRSIIAEKQKMYCSAGGGIVADSDLEKEYKETLDKIKNIMLILNSF